MNFIIVFSFAITVVFSSYVHCSNTEEEGKAHAAPIVSYSHIKHLSPDGFVHSIKINGHLWNLQWHSSIIPPIEDDYPPENYHFYVQLCDGKGLSNTKMKDLQFASYRTL